MATAEEIASFRLLIAEPDNTAPYTDETLGAILDAAASTQAAASSVWTQKAASYATLVNVSESGSSRNLGDLHKNALAFAKFFNDAEPDSPTTRVGTRISKLRRT
jgi:hypothetical protein